MFQLCQQVDARGLPQGEWGLRLKQALPESQLRMGWLALCLATSTWAWEVSEAPRDLLPMPVCSADLSRPRSSKPSQPAPCQLTSAVTSPTSSPGPRAQRRSSC